MFRHRQATSWTSSVVLSKTAKYFQMSNHGCETGTGKTVEEAKKCFEGGYADIKRIYAEDGKPFTEVEMSYQYDMASFLEYFSKAFTLAGLSRITGINQGQLSHYVTGRRVPSLRTKQKKQKAMHDFANDLSAVSFV